MHTHVMLNYARRLQTWFLKYRANWNGVISVDMEICSVAMSWADQWPESSQAVSYPSPSSQNPPSLGESTTIGNNGGTSDEWAESLALAKTCKYTSNAYYMMCYITRSKSLQPFNCHMVALHFQINYKSTISMLILIHMYVYFTSVKLLGNQN